MKPLSFAVFVVLIGLAVAVWSSNAHNVQAPAGYAAYVVERPILGSTAFRGVLTGPSSTGLSWRLYGDLVSLTPWSYPENFEGTSVLIAKDKLAITGNAHILWRQRPGDDNVRNYMEKFGGLDESHSADQTARIAYENYIKEPFRTLVREEFAKYDGLSVPDNLAIMGKEIEDALAARLKNTPFEVLQVVIGNANPPVSVLEQIALKVAKTQEEQRKQTELNIANKNKDIEKANGEAEGERALAVATKRAEANRILSASITPTLLQYQAIENLKTAQRVYLPLGPTGLPLVGALPVGDPVEPVKK